MWIVTSAIFLIFLYIWCLKGRTGHPVMEKLKSWNYAHRGLHNEQRPENSMSAFRAALDAGYGIELDIHLMKDGNLAVIHDSSLKRTAGEDVQIENLTTQELKQYRLLGSDEQIPLLEQVLELYAGKAPLIVELKSNGNNSADLCEAACHLLDQYDCLYCLESFDPRCVYWLRKNRPDLIRGQLTENFFKSKTSTLPWIFKLFMTTQMLNFLTRPDFVAYKFRDRDHFSNVLVDGLWKVPSVTWTLVNEEEYKTAIAENRIPIFESFEP